MYYKTRVDSETGKKFTELQNKKDLLHNQNKQLAEKYGFSQWTVWSFGRDIATVLFDEEPDGKLWHKNKDGSYRPSKKVKAGKEIDKEFKSVSRLEMEDHNYPVGLKDPFKRIGFNLTRKDFYGFEVGDDWEFEPPTDCEEITSIEYKSLFNATPQVSKEGGEPQTSELK